jgi:hypothetical protein
MTNRVCSNPPDAPAGERPVPVFLIALQVGVLSTTFVFPSSAKAGDIALRDTIDRETKAALGKTVEETMDSRWPLPD